jgi:hypothetical protein
MTHDAHRILPHADRVLPLIKPERTVVRFLEAALGRPAPRR